MVGYSARMSAYLKKSQRRNEIMYSAIFLAYARSPSFVSLVLLSRETQHQLQSGMQAWDVNLIIFSVAMDAMEITLMQQLPDMIICNVVIE